jgi:protein-tyrosine phosphatase
MAQAFLSTLSIDRGAGALIASAGILPGGFPLPTETQDALRHLGFESPGLQAFRSRQLTEGLVMEADLVLGLAREHVREVVVLSPPTWAKSFTLKELIRRGAAIGPKPTESGLPEWLASVSNGRSHHELLGASEIDDVIDPAGGAPAAFVRTATEIRGLCVSLAALLWP